MINLELVVGEEWLKERMRDEDDTITTSNAYHRHVLTTT